MYLKKNNEKKAAPQFLSLLPHSKTPWVTAGSESQDVQRGPRVAGWALHPNNNYTEGRWWSAFLSSFTWINDFNKHFFSFVYIRESIYLASKKTLSFLWLSLWLHSKAKCVWSASIPLMFVIRISHKTAVRQQLLVPEGSGFPLMCL